LFHQKPVPVSTSLAVPIDHRSFPNLSKDVRICFSENNQAQAEINHFGRVLTPTMARARQIFFRQYHTLSFEICLHAGLVI